MPSPESTDQAARSVDRWRRFSQRHLHDYNRRASRIWLGLASAGAFSLLWALWRVVQLPAGPLIEVLVGTGLAVGVSFFQVQIPRTRYYIGVADVFVFSLLALHGVAAAVVAAAAEGAVGALRNSKRLSSRVSTPAASGSAMLLAGSVYSLLTSLLPGLGMGAAVASLAGLCLASLVYFAGCTLPLLGMMAAKTNQRLHLPTWLADYGWLAAMFMISATIAGILVINARQFGPTIMLIAGAVALCGVSLLRASVRHHENDRAQQDLRMAQVQQDADLSQRRFLAAFTNAAIGMALVDEHGVIYQVNKALCGLVGRPEPQLLGQPFSVLIHEADAELMARTVQGLLDQGSGTFSREIRCRFAPGLDTWVSLHCSHFDDPMGGARPGMIYQLHDITSRRTAEREMKHMAYHDSLTDLANRKRFNEQLSMAVERSRMLSEAPFAVLFLDLDRFKVVNDSLGHLAGNLLLREVARRLSKAARPHDLVARLGGDEFAILLHQVQGADEAMAFAQHLLVSLSAPVEINHTEVVPSASIGITVSDLGYRTTDEILRDADLAMYAAKADGRSRVALFDHTMHEQIADKLRLEGDLRRAIGEGQLSVVYQPLFDLHPLRLFGFEALARWMHPERGAIPPAVFVALAEESGHIEALTAWVVEQAVGQLALWHRAFPGQDHLHMHVNISGRDLAGTGLVNHVRGVLAEHQLNPGQLTLEITETTLMSKLDAALATLNGLRQLGVRLSIDDFGTGYSSLAYLGTLPIDSLKIDRSFVIGMHNKPENVEIVRAVFNLGQTLGMSVVAEGIETGAQLDALKAIGVHIGQGNGLSVPLSPAQVPALFRVALRTPL
jgi:diguanylate cyclase (GGDEF)-like protein/PAS domain S-box-containing protein